MHVGFGNIGQLGDLAHGGTCIALLSKQLLSRLENLLNVGLTNFVLGSRHAILVPFTPEVRTKKHHRVAMVLRRCPSYPKTSTLIGGNENSAWVASLTDGQRWDTALRRV